MALWIGVVLAKILFIKINGTVDWSSAMTKLLLPQRVAKTIGCLFDIEMMVWEKTVSANFGGAWWGCRPHAADTWR
jgi:hypothetical protein